MTDIALQYDGQRFDIALGDDGDLMHDDSLQNAVILSLFLDRRTGDDDVPPGDDNDRRGWWADEFADVEGDLIGSHLWLLSRAKQTPANVDKAQTAASTALDWMIDDDVTDNVEVESEIVRDGVLGVRTAIHRPGEIPAQWQQAWEVQLNG